MPEASFVCIQSRCARRRFGGGWASPTCFKPSARCCLSNPGTPYFETTCCRRKETDKHPHRLLSPITNYTARGKWQAAPLKCQRQRPRAEWKLKLDHDRESESRGERRKWHRRDKCVLLAQTGVAVAHSAYPGANSLYGGWFALNRHARPSVSRNQSSENIFPAGAEGAWADI